MLDAMEAQTLEARMAAMEVVEAQRKTAAEAWQLEAQAKADRAHELYKASMYEDAARLAEEAVQQDPANIYAHMFAAWSHEALGATDSAELHYRKQIALLGVSYFANEARWFGQVLQGLPDAPELLRAFHEVVVANSSKWEGRWDRHRVTLASRLVDRGLFETALAVITTGKPALLKCAIEFEISVRQGSPPVSSIEAHMTTCKARDRSDLLKEAEDVKVLDKFLSPITKTKIKFCIRQGYDKWRSEIDAEIDTCARDRAKDDGRFREYLEGNKLTKQGTLGFLIWIFMYFGIGFVGILLATFWAPLGALNSLGFIGGIVAAFWITRKRRASIVEKIYADERRNLTRSENERWTKLLHD